MAGLLHTLGIGAEALYANRQGVDTTGHNIANANTEGYSRQRVNVTAREPSEGRGGIIIGNGAYIQSIDRYNDKFVEKQYNLVRQEAGASDSRAEAMEGIAGIFSPELESNIGNEITNFFNALQDLSNQPEDITTRTVVRDSAVNLTEAFKRVENDITGQKLHTNEKIGHLVLESSDLLASIADMNIKIKTVEGAAGNANDLRDKRDVILSQLNSNLDINYYEDENGMVTVRGPGDVLLVERGQFSRLDVQRNNENENLFNVVTIDNNNRSKDITSHFTRGKISSLIDVRDNFLNNVLADTDQMAAAIVSQVNDVHREGFGLNDFKEVQGRNFFKPLDTVKGAAKLFEVSDVIMGSTDSISAAISPNAPGDNVIINRLISLKDQKVLNNNNATLTEFYANITGKVGLEAVRADNLKHADEVIMSDLKAKKEAVSGVSLDEEAMNLLRWQSAFTASSKLITTVDEMFDTILSIKR